MCQYIFAVRENETVRENGLVDNSCLTIEEGKPPEKDQVSYSSMTH